MNDDGALYSMNMNFSEVKKLHTDKACYINTDVNSNFLFLPSIFTLYKNNPSFLL